MSRPIEEPTIDTRGDEHHPQYGTVTVTRAQGTPRNLFDSDIKHTTTVSLTVSTATRARDLNRDWIHTRDTIVEIEMSQAQWAAVVSSVGLGTGVPVTLRRTRENPRIPDAPYKPRLEESHNEVTGSVDKLLSNIRDAMDELNRVEENKAGIKERRRARQALDVAIANATGNAEFAVKSMEKAAERVVTQSKADIETAVAQARHLTGITLAPAPNLPATTEADNQ